MFLEPCCIENQLPQLLRRERGHALFQTNGDVTIEKLMQAACCMASGGFGEYWIVVREADIVLMRTLAHWIDRGWIRRLCLLTETDQRTLVATELGTERMKLTDYGWRDGLAASQLFCCVGERETIVVQGEMMLQAATTARVTAYSASVGPNSRMLAADGDVGSLVENLRALLRASKRKARKKASEAQPIEASDPKPADMGESSGTGSADVGDPVGTVPAVGSDADGERTTEGLSPSGSPAEGSADHQPDDDTQPDTEA